MTEQKQYQEEYIAELDLGVPRSLSASVKEQNRHRNVGGWKEIARHPDDRIKQVFFDHFLTDTPLSSSPEKHSMRDNHGNATFFFKRCFNLVADKGPILLPFGRNPTPEPITIMSFLRFYLQILKRCCRS